MKKNYFYSKQAGVALIFILLIVAVLAGLAATMTERMSRQFHRSANVINHQQAYWYALGVEAFGKAGLKEAFEQDDSGTVNLNQAWAIKNQQYPLDNGVAKGSMRDGQACFNLNSLADVTSDGSSTSRPEPVEILVHLLEAAGSESFAAEQAADSAWEFVDSDTKVQSQYGVESPQYESLNPAYQTPDSLMVDESELRSVLGVSPQVMERLSNVLCALPDTKALINVNTIESDQSLLLVGLFYPNLTNKNAKDLIEKRPYDGWASVSEFTSESQVSSLDSSGVSDYLDVTSQYFELDTEVIVDQSRVRLRSLMSLDENQNVEVIRRRLGGVSERASHRPAK